MDKVHPGLITLVILLRYHGVSTEQTKFGISAEPPAIGVSEMLRCAKELGLKARVLHTGWARLSRTPLPGIAGLHSGGFLIVGKASEDKFLSKTRYRLAPRFCREPSSKQYGMVVWCLWRAGRPSLICRGVLMLPGSWERCTSTAGSSVNSGSVILSANLRSGYTPLLPSNY